MVKIKNK